MKWIGLVARLVVGGVWLVAGYLKIADPTENVRAVRAYDLLPEGLVGLVGHSLPILEITVGLCLLLGLVTRWVAAVSAVVLVAFVIGIASAWARGMSIECGCFGGGGGPAAGASDKYPWEIARDIGLLLLSAYLVWRPRTPYSLDERVLPTVAPVPVAAPPAPAGGKGGQRAERTRAAQHAAEIRRAAAAKEQRKRNGVVTAVVLVALLAVVGVGYAVQSTRDTTGQSASAPQGVVDTYALPFGKVGSPVVVDVYEDFMCPFCGQFESAARDTVEKYAGRVEFRYHLIAFLDRASSNRYSTRAMNALGVVLDTSGPEVAKKFHDALYAQQPAEGSAGIPDDQLVELAVTAGAERAKVEKPIRDLKFQQWVRNATDAASKAGVNSTPTVMVDGQRLPQASAEETAAAMTAAIEKGLQR